MSYADVRITVSFVLFEFDREPVVIVIVVVHTDFGSTSVNCDSCPGRIVVRQVTLFAFVAAPYPHRIIDNAYSIIAYGPIDRQDFDVRTIIASDRYIVGDQALKRIS